MSIRLRVTRFTLVALLVSATSYVGVVAAQGDTPEDERENLDAVVSVDQDVEITALQTVQGDVVVVRGDIDVEDGGIVQGDVLLLRGDARIDGEVHGNVVALGGVVDVGTNGVVGGQVLGVGSEWRTVIGAPFSARIIAAALGRTVMIVVTVISAGFLAALIAACAPRPLTHVSRAIESTPVVAGLLGLLSLAIGLLATIVMSVTCIFIPLAVIVVALYAIAVVLGWSALGLLAGRYLLGLRESSRSLWPTAMLGACVLTLAVGVLGAFPNTSLIGAGLGTLGLAVGLGAVALTRFGAQTYE